MRARRRLYKWQRQRKEEQARRERVRRLQSEVSRAHWLIGRLDKREHHKEVKRLVAKIRTLEQQIRYINVC